MTLIQSLLIASWAGISGNYAMDYLGFGRPIVGGFVVGIVLGDVTTGVAVGAVIEAMFLGIFTVGAAIGVDYNLAGIIGTALGISSGYGIETAVAIAVPVSLLGQFIMMSFVYPMNLFPLHLSDKFAKQGKTRLIELSFYSGVFFWFVKGFLPTFLALYFGVNLVESIFNAIPNWIVDGFNVVGGILPALGFAMLLDVIGISKKILAFFMLGFVLLSYTSIDIIGLAIIGVIAAFIMVSNNKSGMEGA